MRWVRFLLCVLVCLAAAAPLAEAADQPTLLRLVLADGGTLTSFGEYARVGDRVILSMPIGGTTEQPRLQVVTLPAAKIDWPKTEQFAASARYQWYARSRGEEDFERLSADVARVLNEVAIGTDRRRALDVAESARKTLAEWPRAHFGYRQADVQEITAVLDEAISNLRASLGISQFELALVAPSTDIPLEPLLDMPSAREQLDQLIRVAALTDEPSDRMALLRASVELLDGGGTSLNKKDASALRRSLLNQLHDQTEIDARYASLARRFMETASRAAARARIDDVEDVLNRIGEEDRRLGKQRPEAIESLRTAVQAQLDAARRFRLLKDRWSVRQALYREYQRSAGVQLLQLAKIQPALDAIRRLDGPPPDSLTGLRKNLSGGAARLQRIGVGVPEDLRGTNDVLVSAWRFAETAVNGRYNAVTSGNVSTAWEASSAAAAALILLERAQRELRTFLEPPRF